MTDRRSFLFEDKVMRAHAAIQSVQTRMQQALIFGYMTTDTKRVCAALLKDATDALNKLPEPEDKT